MLGYPNQITSAPSVRIVGVDESLFAETRKLLQTAKHLGLKVEFQYDTTFNMCPYYVSVLIFAHAFLNKPTSNKSPSIPFAEFFAERKDNDSHDEFWKYMKEVILF
jgi:hypothetical protein